MSSERLRRRTTVLFISTLHGQAQRTLHEFHYFQAPSLTGPPGNSVAWGPQLSWMTSSFVEMGLAHHEV